MLVPECQRKWCSGPVQLQPFAVLSKSGGTRHKWGLVFVLVKLLLFKLTDDRRAVPLTFSSALISGRVVEREAQWNQGSNLQDDESNILQGLPYQLQEGFWLLWRYQVFPIYFFSFVQVRLGACKTWKWYRVSESRGEKWHHKYLWQKTQKI